MAVGRQAISNTGDEKRMRAELAAAVAGVIAGMNPEPITVTDAETDLLLAAANLVTLSRTSVEYDYRGDVIDAHAPEANTRFPKQLTQIVRGAVAVGMDRNDAMRLAIRCARDSMPPMRLAIIDDLAQNSNSTSTEVSKRLGKPRATVDRQLQALHILGVAVQREEEEEEGDTFRKSGYSLAVDIDPDALWVPEKPLPEISLHTPNPNERSQEGRGEEREREEGSQACTDFSGNGSTSTDPPPPHPGGDPPMDAHTAYRNGLCKSCRTVRYRPGGTQCEECFQAEQDALILLVEQLGAAPVDPTHGVDS